ncbi:hypothetical protein KVMX100_220051 [Klebsiella variicola]|nr:hypothetical protein KVMX100_220051 [Klebsiella variicola]
MSRTATTDYDTGGKYQKAALTQFAQQER